VSARRREGAAPSILTEVGARRLTQRIRAKLADLLDLLVDAWEGRAWEALGHPSWKAYLDAEIPEVRLLKLPIDERRDAVAAWHARGVSQRAIAAGLNVSPSVVNEDLRVIDPAPDEDATVVSLDGARRKARTRRPEPEPAPTKERKTDRAVAEVRLRGAAGLTVKELVEGTGWSQTSASATLTRLHDAGRVVPSETVRLGCRAYVLP
jgi:transposase